MITNSSTFTLQKSDSYGNMLNYCLQFCGNQTPAGHLRFIDSCNFKTMDRLKHSWLATAPAIWNRLPGDIILQGQTYIWLGRYITRSTALGM